MIKEAQVERIMMEKMMMMKMMMMVMMMVMMVMMMTGQSRRVHLATVVEIKAGYFVSHTVLLAFLIRQW